MKIIIHCTVKCLALAGVALLLSACVWAPVPEGPGPYGGAGPYGYTEYPPYWGGGGYNYGPSVDLGFYAGGHHGHSWHHWR